MTRRTLLGAAAFSLCQGKNWEKPVFPEWSAEFIDKVLTDSPWAQEYNARFKFSAPPAMAPSGFAQIGWPGGTGIPGGRNGNGLPFPTGSKTGPRVDDGSAYPVQTEIYLTTRWASALPVRQALALAQFGRGGLEHPKAVSVLEGSTTHSILEVAGFPVGSVPHGARRLEEQLKESATLLVKGRKQHAAESVTVPEHGTHLMATLRFKRFEDLQDSEGFIEFTAQAGAIRIAQKFRLRDMNFRGRLEL